MITSQMSCIKQIGHSIVTSKVFITSITKSKLVKIPQARVDSDDILSNR